MLERFLGLIHYITLYVHINSLYLINNTLNNTHFAIQENFPANIKLGKFIYCCKKTPPTFCKRMARGYVSIKIIYIFILPLKKVLGVNNRVFLKELVICCISNDK